MNRSKVSLDNFLNIRYNYFQLPYQFHLLYWRLFLLFSLVNYAVSLGVAGAAFEHPLEGEAEDPTGAGYMQNAHSYEWT